MKSNATQKRKSGFSSNRPCCSTLDGKHSCTNRRDDDAKNITSCVGWNLSPEIQDHIRLLARKEVKRMYEVGLGGHYDADDLCQEVNLALEIQKERYNPELASRKTFVEQIANGVFMHIERYLGQQQRDVRLTSSLFEGWSDDDADEAIISDCFDYSDNPDADLFMARLPSTDDVDFLIWLDEICDRELDSDLSQLVRWFREDGTIPELAEKTLEPKPTWYSRRNALRKFFGKLKASS